MRLVLALILALAVAGCTPKPPPPRTGPSRPKPPVEEPSPLAHRVNEALRLAAEGDYPEAILQLKEAVARDPKLAEAWYNLGIIYRRLGQSLEAEASLARAVKLDSGRSDYLYAHGTALFDLERWKKAERAFDRAFRKDGNLPALFSLGQVFEKRGKLDKARKVYEEYLRRDGESVWARRAAARLEDLSRSGRRP